MPDLAESLRAVVEDLSPRAGSPVLPARRAAWWAWLPHIGVGVVAAVMAGVCWHTLIEDFGVANEVAGVLSIAQATALVLALYWPVAGWWLALGALIAAALMAQPEGGAGPLWPGPNQAAYLGVLALVAFRVRPRALVLMWIITQLCGLALVLVFPDRDPIEGMVLMAGASGAVLVTGGALRSRAEALRRLAAQQRAGEEERSRAARLEQRARIARELHDVVAHHLSVIAIQAEAGPLRAPDPPPEVLGSFAMIRANALQAMAELHRVLEILRSDEAAEGTPQPSLVDVEGLLQAVRAAGLSVSLDIRGQPRPLPPGVELSAYRIVQESLSNVLRHAPDATAEVIIEHRDAELVLVVQNTAARAAAPVARTPGHGLLGMQERVSMLNGRLEAGPRADGGYRVRAAIPLPEEDAP